MKPNKKLKIDDTLSKSIMRSNSPIDAEFEALLTGLNPGLIETLRKVRTNDTSLKNLDLGHKKLDGKTLKALSIALKTNTSLRYLNLTSNNIEKAGAKDLSLSIISNTTLAELFLEANNIQDAGADYLAQLLKINTSVTYLNLGANNIGAKGAKFLADAIKSNTTLNNLDLWGNNIGNAGAIAIIDALTDNTTVTNINLGANNIVDQELLKSIYAILVRNRTLKKQIDDITKPLYKLDGQNYPTWQTKSLTHATELNKNINQIIAQNPIFKQSKLLQELYSLQYICLAHHCYNEYLFGTEYNKEDMLKLVTEYLSCAEVMGYNTTLVQQIVTTDINETLNAHHRMYLDKTLPGNIEREAYRNTQRREYYAYARWQLRQSLNWPKPTEQELIKAAEPLNQVHQKVKVNR